ncbi:MAG: Gfo/Idh/MocA family oxidoreductase [Betaproteobacteria bacterium]
MSVKPVKIAVIGYGWWGKTIVATLEQSPLVKVVMVIESDPKVRELAAQKGLKDEFVTGESFEEAIANPNVEAVILCTPHLFHASQIQAAAKAGKHVFCEKPLCLTYADAKASIAACESANLILGIGHERRFEPAVIALREEIKKGTLGHILQIEANFSQDKFFALAPDNWRLSNKLAPVGPLTATGIHLVDLAIAILGPAESVWARLGTLGSNFENGDTLAITLAFPNGTTALISAILATPFDGRFCVYGSKGWTEIRDLTHPENPTGWVVSTKLRDQDKTSNFLEPAPAVRNNLEAFANAVRGVAPYPVTHQEMLANVGAIEAIMRSAQTKTIEKIQG